MEFLFLFFLPCLCSPSHEWQDVVTAMLRDKGRERPYSNHIQPQLHHAHVASDDNFATARRQRRKFSQDGDIYIPAVRDKGELDSDGEAGLLDAVGQLSLNEEEEVRFHGKASGLHLLGDRVDTRNEGGIWFVAFLFAFIVFGSTC